MELKRWSLGLALLVLLSGFSGCDDVTPRPKDDVDLAETGEGIVDICGDRRCAVSETCCDGQCVELDTDEQNCGVCGVACEGTETCSNGACLCPGPLGINSVCEIGLACCLGFGCVEVDADPFNCGVCGQRCGAGESCEQGECGCGEQTSTGPVCDAGTICCGNPSGCAAPDSPACDCGGSVCGVGESCCGEFCSRLDRDVEHCGSCERSCSSAQRCSNGQCSCQYGYYDCDSDALNGCETRVFSDHLNCGSCGRACQSGQVCSQGQCVQSCQAWENNCGGSCVELPKDRQHCGSCFRACESGEVCSYGSCATSCQGNLNNCAGNCVNYQTDRHNCGSCGRECPTGEVCWSGFCSLSCPADLQRCNDTCADLQGDSNNCGACYRTCEAGEVCADGECAVECPAGREECDGGCVNTTTDRAHCGACGVVCGPGDGCYQGNCQTSCPTGQFACDALCVDPQIDPSYCGGSNCLDGDVCLDNEACRAGLCICGLDFANCNDNLDDGCEAHLPTDEAHCGACFSPCAAGDTCCSGTCLDRNSDVNNCSECGNICPTLPNAIALCTTGKCTFKCEPGFGDCDGQPENGCEMNVLDTLDHCGVCNNACTAINATASCSMGACTLNCEPNFMMCDGRVDTGCESNIATSLENCGGCGNLCGAANANPACVNQNCQLNCLDDYGDCDGDTSNGCETKLLASTAHCGACNQACSTNHASSTCSMGACVLECAPGFDDCNGDVSDGCETNIATNPMACGGCGVVCGDQNATPVCTSGVCVPLCDEGFGDCDGDASNGCETALINNDLHCGGCGNSCGMTNAYDAFCSVDSCFLDCDFSFADCDGVGSNGCEVFLDGDPRNCGTCGNVCAPINGAAFCGMPFANVELSKGAGTAAECQLYCNWNFDNCDGDPSNGCETSLSDINNCGGCGYVCGDQNTLYSDCFDGEGFWCAYECLPEYQDCDYDSANACEAHLPSDIYNCGFCGNVCSNNGGTPLCNDSVCETLCAARREDCDGLAYNGCEADFDNDPFNCNGCGIVCEIPNAIEVCNAGVCAIGECEWTWGDDPNTPEPDCDFYVGS